MPWVNKDHYYYDPYVPRTARTARTARTPPWVNEDDYYYDPYVPMTARTPMPSNSTAMERSTAVAHESLSKPNQGKKFHLDDFEK